MKLLLSLTSPGNSEEFSGKLGKSFKLSENLLFKMKPRQDQTTKRQKDSRHFTSL